MSENINEIAGVEASFKVDELKFNKKGLIPAIVQDHYSKKVLMMAWMNKESLEISFGRRKPVFTAAAVRSSGERVRRAGMCSIFPVFMRTAIRTP